MQENKYFICVYHPILFFVTKDIRLNSRHYIKIKIYNKKELQNIAINHSADIDYKDFLNIYMKCISEPYTFLTIDTTLPANGSLRSTKIFYSLIKITITDEFKTLDDKAKANQAQYDRDRESTKVSPFSSKKMDKYEYLSGEDLRCKPGGVEQVKFKHSPLSKVFNKELEKERLLERLKNSQDKNEEQLQMIKNKDSKDLRTKSVTNNLAEKLSQETNTYK